MRKELLLLLAKSSAILPCNRMQIRAQDTMIDIDNRIVTGTGGIVSLLLVCR